MSNVSHSQLPLTDAATLIGVQVRFAHARRDSWGAVYTIIGEDLVTKRGRRTQIVYTAMQTQGSHVKTFTRRQLREWCATGLAVMRGETLADRFDDAIDLFETKGGAT